MRLVGVRKAFVREKGLCYSCLQGNIQDFADKERNVLFVQSTAAVCKAFKLC